MKSEKNGVEIYPALNRVFINGEWIGSPLFSDFIDIDEPIIDLGKIIQMEEEFDITVNTPSSSFRCFAHGIRLNMEKMHIEIMLESTRQDDPIIAGLFTFTNSLVQLNKENDGYGIDIELILLPAELYDPKSFKDVKFPLWFPNTSCLFGNTYERTCVLLNDHHELMYYHDDSRYTPKTVEMCEAHAKYLNQKHVDRRTEGGYVSGKLVLYENELYMMRDFQKDVIDGTVTETKGITLTSISSLVTHPNKPMPKFVTVPIFEFIEDCQWISPYSPVANPDNDTFSYPDKIMNIVTGEYILHWRSTDHGAEVYTIDHCNKAEFLEAFNTIVSHVDKGIGEIGYRLNSILHIYDRPDRKPDLTAFVIPNEYGGGIIVTDKLPEYLNEDYDDCFENYCNFDSEEEEDIDEQE